MNCFSLFFFFSFALAVSENMPPENVRLEIARSARQERIQAEAELKKCMEEKRLRSEGRFDWPYLSYYTCLVLVLLYFIIVFIVDCSELKLSLIAKSA